MAQSPQQPEAPVDTEIDPHARSAPLTLNLPQCWELSDDALLELSAKNDGWLFELSAEGALWIMSPEGLGSSKRGMRIGGQIVEWSDRQGGGEVLGPQLGVRLPNSALRMPDVAWISDARLILHGADPESFLRSCPELIVEVVSRSDDVPPQHAKMEEWVSNGALLGWLIDPFRETVTTYRPGAIPEELARPDSLSGEEVCAGLEVRLERVWQ